MNNRSISLQVCESTGVGEARRLGIGLANSLGFDSVKAGEVGIIVTELASNLWRHAGEGEIFFRCLIAPGKMPSSAKTNGLEILAIDKGPGMADLEQCLRDGYTTAGSAGIGLGAVVRLSSYSEIFSRTKQGTVILSRVWATPPPKPFFPSREIGAVCVPLKGEMVCGDAWSVKTTEAGQQLLLVDGLGHGLQAAAAADQAVRTFCENELSPKEMIQKLHVALKDKVGAVIGLVEITPGQTFSFIGVGNIEGRILNAEEKRNLLSHNGTVGHALQTVRQWEYAWRKNSLLILHSDGISGKWDLEKYPGLATRHPSIIAGVIYRDFRRERDDASVIVLREPPDSSFRE